MGCRSLSETAEAAADARAATTQAALLTLTEPQAMWVSWKPYARRLGSVGP